MALVRPFVLIIYTCHLFVQKDTYAMVLEVLMFVPRLSYSHPRAKATNRPRTLKEASGGDTHHRLNMAKSQVAWSLIRETNLVPIQKTQFLSVCSIATLSPKCCLHTAKQSQTCCNLKIGFVVKRKEAQWPAFWGFVARALNLGQKTVQFH